MSPPPYPIIPTTSSRKPRYALLVVAGLALAGAGVAAGLMLRPAGALPDGHLASATGTTQEVVTPHTPPAPQSQAAANGSPGTGSSTPLITRSASVCAACGTVEGVRAVQRKGEGSGVGAVAGGVVGAVVGNQMGGGNGKKAMTVIGAIGGGVAGNELEKQHKSTTVYEVRVRMDDGSLRSFTSASQPQPGAAVRVEGDSYRVVQRNDDAPRTVRTSG